MHEWQPELVASAAGAFVGALAAFVLEAWRRGRDVRAGRIEAGYRVLLALGDMRAHAAGLYEGLVKPWRDKPGAWFETPMLTPFPIFDTRLDVGLLEFLMRNGKPVDLQAVQNALVAERMFYAWHALLGVRNQEKIAAMELMAREADPRTVRAEAELKVVFGIPLKRHLMTTAAALPSMYDKVHALLNSAINDLHDALARNILRHDFQVPHLASDPDTNASGRPNP
jgi:hypothetical protein